MFGGEKWGFAGFDAYLRVFRDPWFWNALKNNIYIVLVSVFGQLPLGFIFAYFIYARIVKAPEFWQGVLYVPNIISVIVVGLLWQTIFSPAWADRRVSKFDKGRRISNQLRGIFNAAGGFSLSDDVIQKILDLVGPSGKAIFS